MAHDENQIMLMLGQISADVKHIKHTLDGHASDIKEVEDRMSIVERFQAKIVGIALVVPLGVQAFFTWIKSGGGV